MRSNEISLHSQVTASTASRKGEASALVATATTTVPPSNPPTPTRPRPSTFTERQRPRNSRRALIVGMGEAGAQIVRDLLRHPEKGLIPVGFVEDDPDHREGIEDLPLLGSIRDLPRLVEHKEASVILVATDSASDKFDKDPAQTEQYRRQQAWKSIAHLNLPDSVEVRYAADFYERTWRKIPSHCLHKDSIGEETRGEDLGKRAFDLGIASFLLILLSPLMALVALAVKLDSRGPVFYSQHRNGKEGRAFRVYKFRSMRQDAEKLGGAQWAQKKDPRITRVGRFLRATRLDELPQLLNVLRGEMSLIGPRPERPEFDARLAQVIPHYEVRYRVKPGISGWAQVMYPYGASEEDAREKLAYDLYYLKHRSALLDTMITLKTIQVVLFGKGR